MNHGLSSRECTRCGRARKSPDSWSCEYLVYVWSQYCCPEVKTEVVKLPLHHTAASNLCKQMSPHHLQNILAEHHQQRSATVLGDGKAAVSAKPPASLSRMALEWNPQGTRGRVRPKQTWRRSMLNELANGLRLIDETWLLVVPNSSISICTKQPGCLLIKTRETKLISCWSMPKAF